jgi:sec-independent protein translocase protein TatA
MDFGLPELIIILVILLLLFGSTRLPKLSRSIGQSAKELREGFSGDGSKEKTAKQDTAPKNNKDKS